MANESMKLSKNLLRMKVSEAFKREEPHASRVLAISGVDQSNAIQNLIKK